MSVQMMLERQRDDITTDLRGDVRAQEMRLGARTDEEHTERKKGNEENQKTTAGITERLEKL